MCAWYDSLYSWSIDFLFACKNNTFIIINGNINYSLDHAWVYFILQAADDRSLLTHRF